MSSFLDKLFATFAPPACGDSECKVSTCICESLTFGKGELSENGYWEHACWTCARAHEKTHPESLPCWPFSNETLNFSSVPVPSPVLAESFR